MASSSALSNSPTSVVAGADGALAALSSRMPAAYVNHGGGPMPLLGQQPEVAGMLTQFASTFPKPKAVLVVTAHWITRSVTVSTAERHSLLFDYGGFPPESYRYTYSPPGSPAIAATVKDLLGKAGIACDSDSSRGIDHGVFVPMMLLYPDASVPVVPISLHASLGADMHVKIGEALAPLRDQGVLILGSGASFHNFDYFFASSSQKKSEGKRHSKVWGDYLRDSLTSTAISAEERRTRLVQWASLCPSARAAQPLGGDEHLIPLHVVAGAARCGKGSEIPAPKSVAFDLEIPSFEWRE